MDSNRINWIKRRHNVEKSTINNNNNNDVVQPPFSQWFLLKKTRRVDTNVIGLWNRLSWATGDRRNIGRGKTSAQTRNSYTDFRVGRNAIIVLMRCRSDFFFLKSVLIRFVSQKRVVFSYFYLLQRTRHSIHFYYISEKLTLLFGFTRLL